MEITSTLIRAAGPILSVIILFLLGFWSPEDGESSKNMVILYVNMVLALIISLASALNELFSFQRKARKYQSARRLLLNMDATYSLVSKSNTANKPYLDKLQLWARENISNIERLLDDENVYELETAYQQKPLPT